MQSPSSPGRSRAIDLLRVVSILWVVALWHVIDYLPGYDGRKSPPLSFVTVAFLGLFTLISGYLMGRKEIGLDAPSLRDFFLRRFGRVYPPFLLAILVYWVGHLSPPETLVKGALLVAMLWGPPPFTLWFMAMIVLFYAVTPFLLALRRRTKVFVIVIASATAVVLALEGLGVPVDPRLAMYLPAYAAGLWLAGRAVSWRKVALLGLALALPGIVLAFPALPYGAERSGWSLAWALGAPVLVFGAAMAADARLPSWSWIGTIAEASYFLYLFHRAVYVAVLKVVQPEGAVQVVLFLLLVGLPLALAVAWIGQRLYDRAWRFALERR